MGVDALRGTQLDALWSSDQERRPAFAVYIWNPRQVTIQDVVKGEWLGARLDISDFVKSLQVSQNQVFENSEDAVSSRCSLVIEHSTEGMVVGNGRRISIDQDLFRDGTAIQIVEGDRRIHRDGWPPIFTGVIKGFPSANTALRGESRKIRIQCFGRAAVYQKQIIVGQSWPFDTDLGDMAVSVAMEELALDREEIRFGEFNFKTQHKANQLTQIGKMQGLYEIMKHVDRKPYFDASGFLVSHDTDFDKPPTYIYNKSVLVKSIKRSQQLKSIVNSVEVTGLNSTMDKITQPVRDIKEVTVTTGYFDHSYRENFYYSDDRTRRVQNTSVHRKHGGGLGQDVEWLEIDEFHGRLTIDTGYAPWIVPLIVAVWVLIAIAEYVLDELISLLTSASQAEAVIPLTVMRLTLQMSKAATMVTLLTTLTKLGRYRITIQGEPFEYVYQENRAIAALKGVHVADMNELKLTMPWLNTPELSKEKAKKALRRELVKGQQYTIALFSNGLLEVDDIVVIRDPKHLPNDKYWHFYINTIQKSFTRGSGDAEMQITAWHCKSTDSV